MRTSRISRAQRPVGFLQVGQDGKRLEKRCKELRTKHAVRKRR